MRAVWSKLLIGTCTVVLCGALAVAQQPQQEPAKKPEAKPPAAAKPAPQEGKQEGQPGMPSPEEMEKMMAQGQPGPEHEKLQKLAGKWNFEMRWWMDPSQEEPGTCKGTSTYKPMFGGRYVQQEVHSPPGGPPPMDKEFHGLGYVGYDNIRKEYVSVWFDDMSTMMMFAYGTADASGKTITYTGECADCMTGKKDQKFRNVIKLVSDDKHTMEMYVVGRDGKEFKTMEIVYTRAGA